LGGLSLPPLKTELEILIKTVLEGRGISATKEELRDLSQELQRSAAAGEDINTSGKALEETLTKIRGSAKQTTSAWEQMTEAQKADQRELAQRQIRLLQNEEAQKRAASASRTLTKELGAMRLAGQGVNNVLNGLSQGGIGGMIQAGRGLVDISRAASAGVGVLTSALKLAGPAALAAGAAIALMKKAAADNQKEMEKVWDDAAKNREARTKAFEENTQRVIAALKEEKKAVEEVALAYERRQAGIEGSYAREAKLDPAQDALADAQLAEAERAAMAKATTPEAKAQVKENFRRQREGLDVRRKLVGFDNADLRAGLETQAAEEAKIAANERTRAIQAEIADARRKLEEANEGAKQYLEVARTRTGNRFADTSPEAVAARRRAAEAKDYLDKLEKEAGPTLEQNAKTIEAADAQIEAARLTKEITALQRQAYMIIINGQRSTLAATAAAATTPEDRAKALGDKAALDAAVGAMANAPASNPNRDAVRASVKQDAGPGQLVGPDGRIVIASDTPRGPGGTITMNGRSVRVDGSDDAVAKLAKTGEVLGRVMTAVEYVSKGADDAGKRAAKVEAQAKAARANQTGGG
jgi:hypothetical protein